MSASFTSFWKRYALSQGIEDADAEWLADANNGDHGCYAAAFGDIVCLLTEAVEESETVIKATAFLKSLSDDELSQTEMERLSAIADGIAAPALVMEETCSHLALVARRPLHSLGEYSFLDWMRSLEYCCRASAGETVFPQPTQAPEVGIAPLRALWEHCGAPLDAGSDDFWVLTFPQCTVLMEYNIHVGRARFRTLAGDGTANAEALRQLLSYNLSRNFEPYFSFQQGLVWLNTSFFVEGESPASLLAALNKHESACRETASYFARAPKDTPASGSEQQWIHA